MNITSNLKPGQYLNPEPLIRLLAEPIYQAIKAERESGVDDEEDEGNGNRENGRFGKELAGLSG